MAHRCSIGLGPWNHKKMTLGGIYAILSCFLIYKIKIGLGMDKAAALRHSHSIGIGTSLLEYA